MLVSDLVRYDPTRNCFVLKDPMKTYPPKWPDGTPKSMNNAFNWRTGAPSIAAPAKPIHARSKDLDSSSDFHSHLKLRSDSLPYGRSKKFKDITAKI